MGREQVRQLLCLTLDMLGTRAAGLSTCRGSDRNPQTLFVRVLLQLRMVACCICVWKGCAGQFSLNVPVLLWNLFSGLTSALATANLGI